MNGNTRRLKKEISFQLLVKHQPTMARKLQSLMQFSFMSEKHQIIKKDFMLARETLPGSRRSSWRCRGSVESRRTRRRPGRCSPSPCPGGRGLLWRHRWRTSRSPARCCRGRRRRRWQRRPSGRWWGPEVNAWWLNHRTWKNCEH